MPRVVTGGVPIRSPRRRGRPRIERDRVLVDRRPTRSSIFSASFPERPWDPTSTRGAVGCWSARDEFRKSPVRERGGQVLGVLDDPLLVGLEPRLRALAEGDGLRGDDVLSGPPCTPGKTRRSTFFAFADRKDEPPRGPRRVLWSCSSRSGMRNRGSVEPDHEPRDVADVDHQLGANLLSDLSNLREIDPRA